MRKCHNTYIDHPSLYLSDCPNPTVFFMTQCGAWPLNYPSVWQISECGRNWQQFDVAYHFNWSESNANRFMGSPLIIGYEYIWNWCLGERHSRDAGKACRQKRWCWACSLEFTIGEIVLSLFFLFPHMLPLIATPLTLFLWFSFLCPG